MRPEFQYSALANVLPNQELVTRARQAVQADLALNSSWQEVLAATDGIQPAQAWPSALPEQVRAVAQVLASANTALPQSAIEARFKGRGPWKKSLPRMLDTLETLGRARREGEGWRS